jgi:hypothetical protein
LTIVMTAPVRAAPNHVHTNSGQSGSTISTRSSTSAPASRKALPARFDRRTASPYVYVSSP